MKNLIFVGFVLMLMASGCGRYSKPLPPDRFAPDVVKNLSVTAQIEGVRLSWKAPTSDTRGKKLEEIEGYYVYRKRLNSISQVARLDVEEELVATVPDTHLKEIEQIRETLKAQNRPARKVDLPAERYQFEYLDTQVTPGARYAYRVVPINQGGVAGLHDLIAQVLYRGDRSEIILIPVESE